jgi:tetratricopeptide (TPR) repeat protein/tRNA A-37 threonylcarbamoyl transferase component Bud32
VSEKWKVGERIEGRYEIHEIKRGGMGIVFLCYDNETKSPVAIKTFQDKYLTDKDSVDRFMWEAETWVRLEKHKNIVRANYVLDISGRPYIFLEYISGDKTYGSDLRGWIWGNGLDLNTTLNFAIQFCMGMEHAERKFNEMGKVFVHRDIKPENIMVTQDKVVKITDFGLVKAITGLKRDIDIGSIKDEVTGTERFGFSKAGSISGTPPYMSPEQCRGEQNIDIRSDIYAFGCVLYEMLTGRPPFIFHTFDDYRMHHLKVEPRPPKELSSDIPKQLNTLVMKCLEKEPSKRYQDFKSLMDELSEMYFQLTRERIKEEPPQDLAAWEWNNKGVALDNLGKPQEAIECYDRALEINPRYAGAWYNKGTALDDLGKYQEAIVCYDEALEINPRYAEAWSNKGNTLYKLGKFQEAIVCYDEALEINPRYAEAWSNKGVALHGLGKHQEAIACYDKALEINPRLAKIWSNKGNALDDLGKYQEAIDCFDRALEINPRYAEAWYNKGTALDDLGKLQEAIDCYDRALKINPRLAEAWINKGNTLYKLGKFQDEIACYDRALEINPRLAEAWINKGVALHGLGKYEGAIDAFRNFIKFAPPEYAEFVAKVKDSIKTIEAQLGKRNI